MDHLVSSNPNLGLDRRAEFFTDHFADDLPRDSTVLDIGGRWGFYVKPLETRGHDVTVLDVVKPSFQKAPVVIYDGLKIPFQDQSFDASLLVTVLHHVDDLDSLVREVRRVTRKRLIVIEDLYHHLPGRWWTILRDRIYNFEWVGHPCHFKKADEWILFFERHGFKLTARKDVYTWLCGMRILNGIFIFEPVNEA